MKSIEAEKRYQAGEKLVDIARSLGVPAGTVRRWKSVQDWDGKKDKPTSGVKVEPKKSPVHDLPKEEKINSTNPGGVPLDRRSALNNIGGTSTQKRNKYALKMREYETILFGDILDDNERAIINVDYDKYSLQLTLMKALTIRERRIMQEIKKLRDNPDDFLPLSETVSSDSTNTTETMRNKKGEEWTGISTHQNSTSTSKTAQAASKRALMLEETLTRVQTLKQRAIEVLHRMEIDDLKAAIDLTKLELYRQRLVGVIDIEDILNAELDNIALGNEPPAP